MTESSTPTPPPVATLKPRRAPTWPWIVPLAALLFAGWLAYEAWSQRGELITIQLEEGFGLKAGDEVRYRGIGVGRIDAVALDSDMQGVLVKARLSPSSRDLARAGTSFWVVRPQLQLTGVAGLETLVGPRYLAASPANGDGGTPQRHFVGLNHPPVIDAIHPGDLEIVLQSPQRGSLRAGAPVTYRQTRVGTILAVGLNGDASAVEARVHIQQPFVSLIRANTRFWDVGGIDAKLGLTGLSVSIESAEALLAGGVALATPPQPAEAQPVRTGHRFGVARSAEDEWLEWQPIVAIGSSVLPQGVLPPTPLRATIGWKQGRIFQGRRSVQGWVLQTTDGLLGPADLLKPGDKADPESVALEVAGTLVPLLEEPQWERNGLALVNVRITTGAWPTAQQRAATDPEDCVVITDLSENPLPLAASRLTLRDGVWEIDPAIPIHRSLHGACVVSRQDGKLLGMFIATGRTPVVALMPAANVTATSD